MALTKVSTDGVKDDAITKTKIPANQIEASELADNAVDTNAIANNAVTAGKLASGVQTTINNNADNRVITGSGTANTLEAEANLSFNGEKVLLINTAGSSPSDTGFQIEASHSLSDGDLLPALNLNPNNSNTHRPRAAICGVSHNGTAGMHLAFLTKHAADGTQLSTSDEKMRLDTSGRLGIGTTSPAYKLHLNESSSGNNYVHFTNSSTGTSGSDGAQVRIDGNERLILWQAENNDIRFATNNTERMRLLAGGGLTFNGDTAAANALNDYEEGTWTPTTGNSGGGFQNIISATYTKIGRLVNVSLYAVFNSGQPNSNQIRIGGLPFQSISNIYHYAVGRLQGFASDDIVWQVGGTSDYFTPYYNNGIPTYNQVNGYYFLISGSYITDS